MGVKILVVEDSVMSQKIAKMVLVSLGCEVKVAATGKEALNLFKQEKYDVILMDIGLPDIDGIEVAKKIRKIEKGTYIPIIALTANEDYKESCLSSGMNGFLSKPLGKKAALSVIEVAKNKSINLTQRSNQLDNEAKNSG